MPVAASAVEHHYRIVDLARGVTVRRAQRRDVHPKLGQRLAGAEAEILQRRRPARASAMVLAARGAPAPHPCRRRRAGGKRKEQ